MGARSAWANKSQQSQLSDLKKAVNQVVQVGRMKAVPVANLNVTSTLMTRGAQVSFNVLSLQAVDSFVLMRNFSQDPGSAQAIASFPAASLKSTPQVYPVAVHYADSDPAIAGQVATYWIKAVPVSNATSSNTYLSQPQTFDATQQPVAQQITGDSPITQAYTPTTQPLTAVTGVGVNQATIDIAAFQIQYPFSLVGGDAGTLISYNSGAITPLLDNTQYYVFFDDPTYAGGAQTYVVSTDVADVTAGLHRQYLGAIMTPAHGGGGTGGIGGGGGPCFSGNTQVVTRNGAKAIAAIDLNEEVRSLAGWVKVTALLEHWYEGPMHRMGCGEFVTPGHRMWNGKDWIPASEIWPESQHFVGRVYNLHCEGKDDFEHCYRLLNGRVAHNRLDKT